MKYSLEINKEQAQLLVKALDLFSRIGMGQLQIVLEQLMMDPRIKDETFSFMGGRGENPIDEGQNLLRQLKKTLFDLESGAAYSISSREMPDCYRQAWDIHQVIRHHLAWEEKPEGGVTVNFNPPMRSSSEQELPEFHKIDEKVPRRFHTLDEVCDEQQNS